MNTLIKNLSFEIKGKKILHNINLEINDGDFVAILGPSGCGKTSLLRMTAGFEKPTSGEIIFGDEVVSSPSKFVSPDKRNISMVFQSYALWPHKNVNENVRFPILHNPFVTAEEKSQEKTKTAAVLKMVNLEGYEKRMINELSGGQRQRVALARALTIRSNLLLMDEPLCNLDSDLRVEMRKELKRIHRETKSTILYVTHDQNEALALATKIVVMDEGHIQQIGTPREIYENPENQFTARFVGRSNIFTGKWSDEQTFTPENGNVTWKTSRISEAFYSSNSYFVKPEKLELSESEGVEAEILFNEYLGATQKVVVRCQNSVMEIIQSRFNDYEPGEKIRINIKK